MTYGTVQVCLEGGSCDPVAISHEGRPGRDVGRGAVTDKVLGAQPHVINVQRRLGVDHEFFDYHIAATRRRGTRWESVLDI